MDYIPDGWTVIKIDAPSDNGRQIYYKLFTSWKGGYLDGDSYRLNSGITKVEEDENYFYFFGGSGSCYKCQKKGYSNHSSYAQGILRTMIDKGAEHGVDIEVLPEDTDWLNLTNR